MFGRGRLACIQSNERLPRSRADRQSASRTVWLTQRLGGRSEGTVVRTAGTPEPFLQLRESFRKFVSIVFSRRLAQRLCIEQSDRTGLGVSSGGCQKDQA